jgi:nicotinamide-nucleotide amidase
MSELENAARTLVATYRDHGLKAALAESCTGGMVAAAITAVSGASEMFDRGFVTYSNEAKTEMLGVPEFLIHQHGAVSREVARAMAEGCLRHSQADTAVSITGIAGPGGGSEEKPVGLVWFGVAKGDVLFTERELFHGDRAQIREAAAIHALKLLLGVTA